MAYYDSFRAARWIRLINLVLQAVLFLTLFAGLNYIALNHSWRFDLTESRRHSLSPETRSYLENLDHDVHVVVTIAADPNSEELTQAFRDISGLLREYAYLTRSNSSPKGKIDVRYLDVYQNRREAEALELDQAQPGHPRQREPPPRPHAE
ncbi:MAG: Gldg family protein [Lacunisphaera sp.]